MTIRRAIRIADLTSWPREIGITSRPLPSWGLKMDMVGAIVGFLVFALGYYAMRWLGPWLPLLPRPHPCPGCKNVGAEDLSVLRGFMGHDATIIRRFGFLSIAGFLWSLVGGALLILASLVGFFDERWKTVAGVVVGLFLIVWGMRLVMSLPIHQCRSCGYSD